MDAIYGNAVLTINAAAGEDANAGLPGVRSGSRKVEHSVLECRPGCRVLAAQPVITEAADKSYWNTRAWTYQERFLSKRSITFTENQIFFQCQQMLWCEEVCAETSKITDYYQMGDYLPVDWSTGLKEHMYKLHYALHIHKSSNWVEYLRTVEEYSPRILSHDSDILAAFAGMGKVLSVMFRSPLLFGLPESVFDCALLWQPSGTTSIRQMPALTSGSNEVSFPSWSWTGWKGAIVYEDISPHLNMLSSDLIKRTKPLVTWRKQTREGSFVPINSVSTIDQYMLDPYETELPEGWQVSSGSNFDIFAGTYYFHEDAPSSYFCVPMPLKTAQNDFDNNRCTTCIMGEVSSSLLRIRSDLSNTTGDLRCFSVIDEICRWCGYVWPQNSWTERINQLHEFIILSEGFMVKDATEIFESKEKWTYVEDGHGEVWHYFYNVLLIERKGELALRAGIGKIDKARWNSLSTRTTGVCLT